MFKFLLVGFVGFAWGQGGISCGSGFVYNSAVSSCLPTAPGSNCCDATLTSCQDAIKLCMASGAAGTNCAALACATPAPSTRCCDPALIACQTAIRMCLTNTSDPQLCQALACPTASASPMRPQYSATSTANVSPTPRQADATATATATATAKQADPSASNTPRQADASATTTYKQTDISATTTPKKANSSAIADPATVTATATASIKPTPSIYPSRFIKYSFSIRPRPSQFVFPVSPPASVAASLIFPKANYTLLRDPAKLQELQIILACILQLPLESIEITDISTNTASVPFDASIPRLNSNGEIVCITLPNVSSAQGVAGRSLQASDTIVSYNILNANNLFMIDKNTFATFVATDPNMLSYANSIGSNMPTAIPPIMLFTIISPDPSSAPPPAPIAGAIVGGIFGGILIAGVLGVAVLAVARLRNRAPPITTTKKPSLAISNPLNCTNDSHLLFNPVPTRRSG